MPSAEAGPRRGPGWGWLRSQGLGLLCGLATVLLLAIGSVVLPATRDGASAGVGLDDLRGFFRPPAAAHLWLYLLLPVAALYALNAGLATWDTVSRRWRAGVRAPTAYAGAVLHVAFLLALLAHGIGGFLSEERGQVVLTSGWQPLPGFGEARLASLDLEVLPGGMPKEVRAVVELRGPDGAAHRELVGYNQPLSAGWGSRLGLLADQGELWVARLSSGPDACELAEGQGCALAGRPVELVGLAEGAALVRARWAEGGDEPRWLQATGELALDGGRPLQLEGPTRRPAILLRRRDAPGVPVALASALLLAAGVALLWRRLSER